MEAPVTNDMNHPDIKKLISEVLEKGYLMSLAIQDSGGVWACDVIYIYDDNLNIYWMSDPDVRHSKAIEVRSQIAGTITVSGPREKGLGIQFEGLAQKINGPRFDLAVKHYTKRGKSAPKEGDDVLEGDSWYILKPTKIEVINEAIFGFSKKVLEL